MKKIALGILAHVDSGKTTLSEALLYKSGNIRTLGRVDNRDSFLDTFSLERSRGITIFSKQAILDYKDTRFTLIDTPGHVDFSTETERTLQVLDYAILVISATDGVQSHTKTLWNLLSKYNVPVFIFANKMDLDGADKEVVLNNLSKNLKANFIDFSQDKTEIEENLALCDDSLFEKYENGSIQNIDIANTIRDRKAFPVFFGCALNLEGIDEFIGDLDEYTIMPNYRNEFGAKVFKISEDKGQRLTHIKVTGGTLKVKEVLNSKNNTENEKINQIRLYSGDKFESVNEVDAGTICALTGITFTKTGDGLGKEANSISPILEPVLTYNLNIEDGTDVHTTLQKIKILEDEDPQLKIEWNERLECIQIKLMGDIQVEVLQSVIKDRFNIDVSFDKGSIIYKETIKDTVEGVGHFEPLRHYAEVHLILKPAKRGSGVIFKTDCKEDLLDKNWQRLILTHLYEKTHLGVLTGSPITDIEITLASGKAHNKHTEGGDFRQATYRAVRHGLRNAQSTLLEPIYEYTLEVPSENIGKAMSDIQLMHGTFDTPETIGDTTIVMGTCPVSTMCDYSTEVRKYTHGQGKLSCNFKGYDICHNEEEIIDSFSYDPDSDTQNSCDSIFCSHGAGYTVKWDKVKDHMHLPSALSTKSSNPRSDNIARHYQNRKTTTDIFALDKELIDIFEKTYGKIKQRNENIEESHFDLTVKKKEKAPKPIKSKYTGPEYLLVDGYNVIFAWNELNEISKEDNLSLARDALIRILSNYQGFKKCNVILVFDAYKVSGKHREVEKIEGIDVVYTKEAETADAYIEKASHILAKDNKVRVVTSDALEQLIILGNGALRVSSREFLQEIHDVEEKIKHLIEPK